VHSQGGIVLEHVKMAALHLDLGPEDRFHWYSSSGWIMWNCQLSGLLLGSTACIYDGNPGWPDWNTLWRFVGETGVTFFGAGAAFFLSCLKARHRAKPGRRPVAAARRRLHRLALAGGGLSVDLRPCPAATSGSIRSPAAPTSPAPLSAACRSCPSIRAKCSAAASARQGGSL
jgi:acyl-coenzyme A synthetase/AMP-(fatty) acid ligase